jgi:putative phosphoribosyl transferase
MLPFSDRAEAGRLLASRLKQYKERADVVVMGLPRGGIPVAFEIAQRLGALLDLILVRKLGVPWQPELAMGAVAEGGTRILDHAMIRSLNLSNDYLYGLIKKEEEEIERQEALFRSGHPAPNVSGSTVILVDDGAATGSTMVAATQAVRIQGPKEIVIAVPVASGYAYDAFETEAGKCICLRVPEPFFAVAEWYQSFPQVTDEEVKALLSRSRLQKTEELSHVQSPQKSDEAPNPQNREN